MNISSDREQVPTVAYPAKSVEIDWNREMDRRPLVMEADQIRSYLLKPEVLSLLGSEPDFTHRMITDLMWSTGARIS